MSSSLPFQLKVRQTFMVSHKSGHSCCHPQCLNRLCNRALFKLSRFLSLHSPVSNLVLSSSPKSRSLIIIIMQDMQTIRVVNHTIVEKCNLVLPINRSWMVKVWNKSKWVWSANSISLVYGLFLSNLIKLKINKLMDESYLSSRRLFSFSCNLLSYSTNRQGESTVNLLSSLFHRICSSNLYIALWLFLASCWK